MAKLGQQILLSLPEKEGILALALVRQESQAEVARKLVSMALPQLNAGHAGILNELYDAIDKMGVERLTALQEMVTVREYDGERRAMRIGDLLTADGKSYRKTFPWHPEARAKR